MTKAPRADQDFRAARRTSLSVGGVLEATAAWSVYRHRPLTAVVASSLGTLLMIASLLIPPAALHFHRGWMKFATALGYLNSRILLSVMYFGVITPLGLVLRMVGHDPLVRRSKDAPSYWIPRKVPQQARAGFDRSF